MRRAYDTIAERRCKGVRFDELCALLKLHGWELLRVAGSHHIYAHEAYEGIVTTRVCAREVKGYD